MRDRLHDDELPVDLNLVGQLIASQFPEYAHLPLNPLPLSGSSNRLFRLGRELLIRLPRQPGGGASLHKEHCWTPVMGAQLPVTVPEIIKVGQPGHGYPEQWSIVRWIEGELPRAYVHDSSPVPERKTLAADLANVILTLRAIPVPDTATADPALKSYRGRPLLAFDPAFRRNIDNCRTLEGFDLDLETALQLWDEALELPGAATSGGRQWFHGDLVAENLLLADGKLNAILDFGGLSIGDPTIDLHGAWELFDPPSREVFRNALGANDAEWLRGRAWALAIALGCFSYYWETMPERCRDRLVMARAAIDDVG